MKKIYHWEREKFYVEESKATSLNSCGKPQPFDWNRFNDIVVILTAFRDAVIFGFHVRLISKSILILEFRVQTDTSIHTSLNKQRFYAPNSYIQIGENSFWHYIFNINRNTRQKRDLFKIVRFCWNSLLIWLPNWFVAHSHQQQNLVLFEQTEQLNHWIVCGFR